MAEETGTGASAMLSRKVGPLPMYVWLVGAGAVGLIAFRAMKARQAATSGAGSNTGQGTDFSSTQTQTGTTADGGQYSTSYTAQGNGYLPGQLTYGAGQMPYQQGDVYVNYPAQTNPPPDDKPKVPIFDKAASDGKTSLWQYAKAHGSQPELIIWATSSNYQTTQAWNDYINAGNFNAPVPPGQLVFWPVPG